MSEKDSATGGSEEKGAPDTSDKAEPGVAEALPLSEDIVALLFVDRHGEKVRFWHDNGTWYRFDGSIWRPDETKQTYQQVREFVRKISAGENPYVARKMRSTSFCSGVEKFVRGDPRVAVTGEHWDSDPWLLGTPSGTVDLKTGMLFAARPDDFITRLTTTRPSDTADCPLWLRFLEEVTGHDTALVRHLKRVSGYGLTGVTSEQALWFLFGPGGNGKGVFLRVIAGIMRTYAGIAAMDTFEVAWGDRHPTDLAKLRGLRLVTATETEEHRKWSENRIKQLTGGDVISARFMRQDFFEYTPQFKLVFSGNTAPQLGNIDDAGGTSMNDEMKRMVLRNKLVGMWAAEKLGLVGESAEAYSNELARGALDFERSDVLSKIRKDFSAAGVVQSDEQILGVMTKFWLEAGSSLEPTTLADPTDAALVQIARNLKST